MDDKSKEKLYKSINAIFELPEKSNNTTQHNTRMMTENEIDERTSVPAKLILGVCVCVRFFLR